MADYDAQSGRPVPPHNELSRAQLESDDVEQIKAKTDALQSAFHRVSEQIYAQAAEQRAAPGDGDGHSSGGATTPDDPVPTPAAALAAEEAR